MRRPQFGIRSILVLTFGIGFVVAVLSQQGTLVQRILVAILLANFLGAIAALIVTFVLRFPRDGSYRQRPDEPGEGSPKHPEDPRSPD